MLYIIVAGLAGGVACGMGLAWALLPAVPLGGPSAAMAVAALAAVAALCGIRHFRQPPTPTSAPAAADPPADHSQEIRELLAALDRLNRTRAAPGAEAAPRQLVKGE